MSIFTTPGPTPVSASLMKLEFTNNKTQMTKPLMPSYETTPKWHGFLDD